MGLFYSVSFFFNSVNKEQSSLIILRAVPIQILPTDTETDLDTDTEADDFLC